MPVPPKPFLVVCPKCKASALIRPTSDALSPMDLMRRCKKCDVLMKRSNEPIGLLDELKSLFN